MWGPECMKQENIQTAVVNALQYHANYKDENEPESREVVGKGSYQEAIRKLLHLSKQILRLT